MYWNDFRFSRKIRRNGQSFPMGIHWFSTGFFLGDLLGDRTKDVTKQHLYSKQYQFLWIFNMWNLFMFSQIRWRISRILMRWFVLSIINDSNLGCFQSIHSNWSDKTSFVEIDLYDFYWERSGASIPNIFFRIQIIAFPSNNHHINRFNDAIIDNKILIYHFLVKSSSICHCI